MGVESRSLNPGTVSFLLVAGTNINTLHLDWQALDVCTPYVTLSVSIRCTVPHLAYVKDSHHCLLSNAKSIVGTLGIPKSVKGLQRTSYNRVIYTSNDHQKLASGRI